MVFLIVASSDGKDSESHFAHEYFVFLQRPQQAVFSVVKLHIKNISKDTFLQVVICQKTLKKLLLIHYG